LRVFPAEDVTLAIREQHAKVSGAWRVPAVFHFRDVQHLLAMIAVTIIYRWARPKEQTLGSVIPGALIATLLWWVADLGFGFYVRKMPYGMIYGGLAAVIGLLIWMELSTVIIFLGAAWNAELAESRRGARASA